MIEFVERTSWIIYHTHILIIGHSYIPTYIEKSGLKKTEYSSYHKNEKYNTTDITSWNKKSNVDVKLKNILPT